MKITWLGHSTVSIELSSGKVILIDPWIEGNPSYPGGHELQRVDLMLITHGHSDHISDAVAVAKKFKPSIMAIYEVCQWLGGKGAENLVAMNKGGTADVGGVKVTMTQAQHSSMIEDDGRMIYAGEPAGYVVDAPEGRPFYHAGDTNVFSDMRLIRELYEPALAMLPIGDRFTMGPREAALACRFLQPSHVLPIHWGTFPLLTGTPGQLKERLAEQPAVTVVDVKPGRPFEW
jgi:L-ascorbate metabolism protein UlaG (beta-lactamase superfamily)